MGFDIEIGEPAPPVNVDMTTTEGLVNEIDESEPVEVGIEAGGADKHFKQDFSMATHVTVIHNLGKQPSVTVVDSAGDEVIADVNHIDDNSLVATWAADFSGTIYCN